MANSSAKSDFFAVDESAHRLAQHGVVLRVHERLEHLAVVAAVEQSFVWELRARDVIKAAAHLVAVEPFRVNPAEDALELLGLVPAEPVEEEVAPHAEQVEEEGLRLREHGRTQRVLKVDAVHVGRTSVSNLSLYPAVCFRNAAISVVDLRPSRAQYSSAFSSWL